MDAMSCLLFAAPLCAACLRRLCHGSRRGRPRGFFVRGAALTKSFSFLPLLYRMPRLLASAALPFLCSFFAVERKKARQQRASCLLPQKKCLKV
jgi:hypothetical protein